LSWSRRPSIFWGGLLVIVGVLFLLANAGLLDRLNWDLVWPSALIVLGLWVMAVRFMSGEPVSGLDRAELLEGLTSARLEIAVGSGRLDLSAADLGEQLYRVHADQAGAPLEVRFDRSKATLSVTHRPGWLPWASPSRIQAQVSSAVEWDLACQSGAIRGTFDLATARVARFDCKTGASRIELNLPAPHGLVPVRVEGGALHLDVSRPAEAAMKVKATGAAVHLVADGARQDGMGSREWLTSNFQGATDRFEVVVEGAATDVTVRQARP
jgi:hypothetical protein